jgi:hypothetical protein
MILVVLQVFYRAGQDSFYARVNVTAKVGAESGQGKATCQTWREKENRQGTMCRE